MSSRVLEEIRKEAMHLSSSERADLAHSLIASLDGTADLDADAAWDSEILRRLAEIDSGSATLIDRDEFSRRMRAQLNRI